MKTSFTVTSLLSALAPAGLAPAALIAAALIVTGWPASPQAQSTSTQGTSAQTSTAKNGTGRRIGESGLTLPRFVSLRASEVNMRTGPGTRYPIDWVYKQRNLPVEIVDEFDTWRRIRDWEGSEGWVHQSMLHSRRSIMVVDDWVLLRRDPQQDALSVARLEPGAIGRLESCGDVWCVVAVQGFKGWLRRDDVYGIHGDEQVR